MFKGKKPATCGAKTCVNEAKARAKRATKNPAYKHGETAAKKVFQSTREKACRKCGGGGNMHVHHVVYEQHVRRAGGDPWAVDNGLTLCFSCHMAHHHSMDGRLPSSIFRPENVAFMKTLLGDGATDYVARYYDGWRMP